MDIKEYIDDKEVILNREYIIPMNSGKLKVSIKGEYDIYFSFLDFSSQIKEKKEVKRISMDAKPEENRTEFTLKYGNNNDVFGLLKKPVYILSSENESAGQKIETNFFIQFLATIKENQCIFFKLQLLCEKLVMDSDSEKNSSDEDDLLDVEEGVA